MGAPRLCRSGDSLEIPDLGHKHARLFPPAAVDWVFDEDQRLRAAAKANRKRIEPDLFWRLFRKRFPRATGFLVLSAPALDDDRQQALVLADHWYALDGGEGQLFLLTRDNARGWSITSRRTRWIS